MSLLGSLDIGKKALTAAQLGQSTTGHNIANVDTKGFSRQNVVQVTGRPQLDGKGQGVDIAGVRRSHDRFTKEKVVAEQLDVGTWKAREQILMEAEILYTDLEGGKLRGALDEFWSSWGSVANQPESPTLRKSLVAKAQGLSDAFNMFDAKLTEFRENLNNQITKEIADLNRQVQQIENRGLNANDPRDKREELLQQLSGKIEVRSFENKRGNLEVQITNGQHLVHGRNSYEIFPKKEAGNMGDFRIGLTNPPGIPTDITDLVHGGSLKEMVDQRDVNIKQFHNDLNEMAHELAFGVNQLHSGGTGINAATHLSKGATHLNEDEIKRPLPFLKSGSFEIKILGPNQEIEEVIEVSVEAGVENLDGIIENINRNADAYQVDELGKESIKSNTKFLAVKNEDGSVSFKSGMGKKFIFGSDETNFFTTMGLNTFFHLDRGASDIHLNAELAKDEMKIVTGSDLIPSDNRIALKIAELQFKPTMNDGTTTFDEFYNKQTTDIGLKVQDAQKGVKAHKEMLDQYEAIRNSISAVNLDEEMTNMAKYQRAYESSAKFMGTVDEMAQTMINM